MKSSILLLIALVLILPVISQEYIPPSNAQLWEYWQSLTKEQQIDEIRKLDIIEHTIPDINFPELNAVLLDNGDLLILPESEINIKINYLEYSVKLDNITIKEFYFPEKKRFKDYAIPILFGAGVAVIGSSIGNDKGWKYGLSAIQGMTFGFIMTFTR